jgi:hypothetical protein
MKIHKSITFQRVHRLGKRKRDQIKPRSIIAKFKEAKESGQRAKLVKDKIFIDNENFIPDYNEYPQNRQKKKLTENILMVTAPGQEKLKT